MLTVQGTFHDGVVKLDQVVAGREGERVVITFLDAGDHATIESNAQSDWDQLNALVTDCQVNTGQPDLAREHDHYLYGKPKPSE